MSKHGKIWVIGKPETPQRTGAGPVSDPRDPRSPSYTGGSSGMALLAAYLLGPLAMLLTPPGRRQPLLWGGGLAAAAGLGWIVTQLVQMGPAMFVQASRPILWVVVAVLGLVCTAAWGRGLFLIGRRHRGAWGRLPAWMRHRGIVGALGLAFPGLGLLLTNRHLAGVAVACGLGVWLMAAAILAGAGAFLDRNLGPFSSLPEGALERVFLVTALVVVGGACVWIVQALIGVRLAFMLGGGGPQPRGDRWAAALALAVVALVTLSRPATLAANLDAWAFSLGERGWTITPLHLSRVAARLDPSEPAYGFRMARFCEVSGRVEEAGRVRADLERRWSRYQLMVRAESPPPPPPWFMPAPVIGPMHVFPALFDTTKTAAPLGVAD